MKILGATSLIGAIVLLTGFSWLGVAMPADIKLSTAVFAGGCFWCMESPFAKIEGVVKVTAGYTGGKSARPAYEEVASGRSGHVEAVQVLFDASRVSYATLVDVYLQQIDPTDGGGQFADRGSQYRPFIFYGDEEQRDVALTAKSALAKSGRFQQPVKVEIAAAQTFWPAEEVHQEYAKKNPIRYQIYRIGSGREAFLASHWRDASQNTERHSSQTEDDAALQRRLTPLQYQVVRKNATEPAFRNEYWDNHADGIYVDIVTGEPLFSSKDKFDSGCGWPSFSRPIHKGSLIQKEDRSLFMKRVEVRTKNSDAHLGHLFDDGPGPDGLRYCINSAALRFVPKEELVKQGYGEYLGAFESPVRSSP